MTAKAKKPKAKKADAKPPADPNAGPAPERQKCEAKTAKGAACRRWAIDGSPFCNIHAGAGVGRPQKLTKEVTKRICEVLQAGGSKELAAATAGIAKQTLYDWLKRGDPEGTVKVDQAFRDFREHVELALAEGEAALVTRITLAASKDWRAAAWQLERMYPEKYGGALARRDASPPYDPSDPPPPEDPLAGTGVVDDQVGPDGQPL